MVCTNESPARKPGRAWAWSVTMMLATVGLAHAQTPATPSPPNGAAAALSARLAAASLQSVQQKLTMVEKLVFDSPVATRVVSSQNDQARRHFNDARELYTHARALSSTGQLRGADLLLNEAIWELGRAQQLVPDAAVRLAEERARFAQLRASAEALLRTYAVEAPDAAGRPARPPERSVTDAQAVVAQARALADEGKVVEANRTMEQALSMLLKSALTRLDGTTLVYDRRFANTREEYAYELERFRSYEQLVPLALLEYRPSAEARTLIDRYVAQARDLRQNAEVRAGASDHAAALQSVVEGTNVLQRALQAAGLVVPQTMTSQ